MGERHPLIVAMGGQLLALGQDRPGIQIVRRRHEQNRRVMRTGIRRRGGSDDVPCALVRRWTAPESAADPGPGFSFWPAEGCW